MRYRPWVMSNFTGDFSAIWFSWPISWFNSDTMFLMLVLYSSHPLGETGSFLALDLDLDLDRDFDRCCWGMRLLLTKTPASAKRGFNFSDSGIGLGGPFPRLEFLILGKRITLRDRGKISGAGGGCDWFWDPWFLHPRLFWNLLFSLGSISWPISSGFLTSGIFLWSCLLNPRSHCCTRYLPSKSVWTWGFHQSQMDRSLIF